MRRLWLRHLLGVLAVLIVAGVGTPTAHARTGPVAAPAGTGVTVAVIDTGFDTAHEYFRRAGGRSAFVAEVCLEVCGAPVVVGHGVAATPVGDRTARRHGTHIAGVIAGAWQRPVHGRFARLRGVAPGASLVGVRIFGDDDGGVDMRRITSALEWLAEHRDALSLDVVNISLGGGRFTGVCSAEHAALQGAVSALWNAGVVIVAGAGNDADRRAMATPGCLRDVVSVAALQRSGSLAPWSNRSATTTVAAPGDGVWSAVPGMDAVGRRAAISLDSGTSVAAAVVTGTIAALLQASPLASPNDIVRALRACRCDVEGIPVLDVTTARHHLTAVSANRVAAAAPVAARR